MSAVMGGPAATSVRVLRRIFADRFARSFAVQLWDGTRFGPDEAPFTLMVNAPSALRAAFLPPIDLNPGRAFAAGLLDIEGDIVTAVDTIGLALGALPKLAMPALFANLLRKPHSRERDAAAVGFHYDQPLAFYQAFLDPAMVYSCAYYRDAAMTLADAQQAKLDYILDKVRIRPGESLLDIGCGWGALVIRAAERGARAVGVTLSRTQYEEANRVIRKRGLTDRARVDLLDYRDLRGKTYDKIVSVGMFEHVGLANLKRYFRAAYEALRPGGLFLNHGIAEQSDGRTGGKVTGFMDRYVFPDGEVVAIGDGLAIAERAGFEVRDVENLREHYARTARDWVGNLEHNRASAIVATSEATYRIWRLYLAGSSQGFSIGRMGLFQSLLARPLANGRVDDLPATRANLYTR
jgi:cyclopropane-fatty-acyl-phospholipid synthase